MAAVNGSSAPLKWRWRLREWEKEDVEVSTSVAEVLIDPLTLKDRVKAAAKKAPILQNSFDDESEFVDPLGQCLFSLLVFNP